MDESERRICRAVASCLTHAAGSENPVQQVDDLLIVLKATTGWTGEEISKVRSRVLNCFAPQIRSGNNR
jgi:hypothetical protein